MGSPVLQRSSRISRSCNFNMAEGGGVEDVTEKLHQKKHQIFSRGLALSSFSKSFVTLQTSLTRIAHMSPLSQSHHFQSAPSSPVGDSPRSAETSACSTPTSVSSCSGSNGGSTPSTPRSRAHHQHSKRQTCVTFRKRHGYSKRSKLVGAGLNERRPVIVDKIPSGKAGEEYIIVYVGIKPAQRTKYVISRDLLSHQLFQVLLKCSEDEFGQDYTQKGGIAIACDAALFLHVVKVVDDSMREPQEGKVLPSTEDEDSVYDSDEC